MASIAPHGASTFVEPFRLGLSSSWSSVLEAFILGKFFRRDGIQQIKLFA